MKFLLGNQFTFAGNIPSTTDTHCCLHGRQDKLWGIVLDKLPQECDYGNYMQQVK